MKWETYILVIISVVCLGFLGCKSKSPAEGHEQEGTSGESDKGIGQFQHVELTHPLDDAMVKNGDEIYKAKCLACHKLNDEQLVGPGWKGLASRRTPEWIMNFVTNTDVMLDSDLVAQQLMVVCIARMPNQNLSAQEARDVLEFIRKNDGEN